MTTSLSQPRLLLAAALSFAAFQTLPATAQDKPAASADPVVASGKGFEIKRSEADEAYTGYKNEMQGRGQYILDSQRPDIESNILQHLILSKILVQDATPDEKMAVWKYVGEFVDSFKKSAPTPEALEAEIKASGTTLEHMTNRAVEERLAKTVLIRKVVPADVVSDAAIKKFYNDNPDKFTVPEQVRAAHILIMTQDANNQPLPADKKKEKEALAKEIRAKAVAGEDFGKLVKQYSEDPGSKDNGGEYTFPRGKMVPQFEEAAFTMKTNQISDLVETQYGYHIIKLLEKIPGKKVDLDTVVSNRIRDFLSDQEMQKPEIDKAVNTFSTNALAEYKVKVLPLEFPPAPAPAMPGMPGMPSMTPGGMPK